MSFVSIRFFCFFALFLGLYKLLEGQPVWQKRLLLAGNYCFYAAFGINCALLLLAVSVFTWKLGCLLTDSRNRRTLFFGMAGNVLVLAFFKYRAAVSALLYAAKSPASQYVLPVGLSFYTFEAISYLVDTYRGKLNRSFSLEDALLYLSFFPIVISGPIMKARDFLPQIEGEHRVTSAGFQIGLQRFAFGAFEKVALADRLGAAVDAVYAAPGAYSGVSLLWNSLSYTLQLFFDFAGYTNMAIGIAVILGYSVLDNFNLPYLARSPSDFWRRWHISLSSWITEYVYIPLGGSRKGRLRTYGNILLAMLLSGIWHGSTLNFLVWGLCHGIAQVLSRAGAEHRKERGKPPAPKLIAIPLTFLLINFLWIPFRTADLSVTLLVLKRILTNAPGVLYLYSYTFFFLAAVAAVEGYALVKTDGSMPLHALDLKTFRGKLVIILLILLTFMLAYFGDSAFIYGSMF